jgi:hypothetical protein
MDVDVAHTIWGKSIAALKGKTTRKKSIPVAGDFIKVPKEFLKLHKQVTMPIDIFFVNGIPFLISPSRKIYYTIVIHLSDRKIGTIYTTFKEIYQYYASHGFQITMVPADGEFAPLQTLIQAIPGGPKVSLTSASDHVPKIERRLRVVLPTSGGKGTMLGNTPHSPFHQHPKTHDDPYRAQCHNHAESLPHQGRNIGHN